MCSPRFSVWANARSARRHAVPGVGIVARDEPVERPMTPSATIASVPTRKIAAP
jgi:hypothetical protein